MSGMISYWKRIFSAYFGGAGSAVTFWHEQPEISEGLDVRTLGRYYMTFAGKAAYTGPRDDEGVILLDYRGSIGRQYNPIAIAQFGLAQWNLFLKTNEAAYFGEAKKHADWLVRNLEANESGVPVWKHAFAWRYAEELKPGWYSGLAQGSGISLLARVFAGTKDKSYLDAARRAWKALVTDVKKGGVRVTDPDGDIWLEEYIVDVPTHILNGFLWTIWGVWDYWLLTGDKGAFDVFSQCVQTVTRNLSRYDIGFWSLYDLSQQRLKMIASPFYHNLHIIQLRVMFLLTGETAFKARADRWERYQRNAPYRALAVAYKALFKLFYF